MKTRRLYTWQFFVGAFIGGFVGLILGSIFSLFPYMKNIDVRGVEKNQKYIMREMKEINKERQEINYIFKERGLIKEHNEEAVIKPKEGK